MKATETRVEDFLSSNKTQFVIPVYQRNYDWTTSQCKQLLDDILEVGGDNKMDAHFIGSIVYIHDDVYTATRIKELTVIDGQQRLTTLTLIYLVIYRLARELKDESLEHEINETFLINKFASDNEKLKLRPAENNDKALKYLMRSDESEEFSEFSKLVDNFSYFQGRITKRNYETVLAGLSKLLFVEVSLDRGKDSPQKIFESLNSTGLALSQADLIRNYILMGLRRRDQTKIYEYYWEVIEKLAKDETKNLSKVSDFIRDYLTLVNKKIPNKGKVYVEFKQKYPTTTLADLEETLADIKSLAKHYSKLINPAKETDKDIRQELEYIDRLEINVTFPFLIKVYDDYASSIIDKSVFLKILQLVQSFTFRRFVVGVPTNALNKIFMSLYDKIDKSNYLYSLQKSLVQRTGSQRFPKNLEVKEALKVKDVYHIKAKNRTYLLERLENYDNQEPVIIDGNQQITIEHVFPQNPDAKWKAELGADEYLFIKENYLNTISNLTLSGNNGKLGNKPFKAKRDLPNGGYRDSRLWLNRYISTFEKWGKEEIERRFVLISQRFLEIWGYPEVSIEDEVVETSETNIFDADDPTNKKLEYAIFFDQKLEITQVAQLYVEVVKILFELQPELFFSTDLGEKIGLTKNPQDANTRQAAQITDTYFIEANMDSVNKFNRIKHALSLFECEDELVIKYAN